MTDQLALNVRAQTYIQERLEQYACWYDKKAITMKRNYQRARVIAAVGSVFVPILANVPWTLSFSAYRLDVARLVTTLISTAVAVLLALEGVLQHREQWKNYRTTEQYLRAQRVLYENAAGEYEGLAEEESLKRLIGNVESAIKDENETTLNVLTRSESATGVDKPAQPQ